MSAIHHKLKQGYWLRQLGLLLRRGETPEAALAQLVKVAEEQDRPALQALFQHHQGMGKLAGFDRPGLLPSRLLQLLERIHPRQEAMTLASYAELQAGMEGPAEAFFARLQGLGSYFSALAIFLLVLINFVLHMVVGPFGQLLDNFHNALPQPTAWLVGLGEQSDLILLVSVGLFLLIVAAMLLLRASLAQRQGFPALLRLLPFLGSARLAYHDAEALQITLVLVRANVPYEKALFIAVQMVGGSRSLRQLEPLLGQAAQLGGIDEELRYQVERLLQIFEQQSQRALQRLMITAYLVVGLLIGFVVVAAYLPIFTLGDLI